MIDLTETGMLVEPDWADPAVKSSRGNHVEDFLLVFDRLGMSSESCVLHAAARPVGIVLAAVRTHDRNHQMMLVLWSTLRGEVLGWSSHRFLRTATR